MTQSSDLIQACSHCHRMIDSDGQSFGIGLLARCVEIVERDKVTHGVCNSCLVIERKKIRDYKKAVTT